MKISLPSRSAKWTALALIGAAWAMSWEVARADETYLPACYKPAPTAKSVIRFPSRPGPFRVALVNGYTGVPWRTQMIQQSKAWAARPENAKHIKELKVVSTGSEAGAQIAAIDNFIQAGFDVIVFDPVNPKAFDAVIRRAKKAGTVLVAFDNPVDNADIVQITPEWTRFESIRTQAVIDQMPVKKGRLLEVRGPAGNAADRDLHAGVTKVLEKYKDIRVTEVVGNWDAGTVQKAVADAITVNGHFDAVTCQYGCQGVTRALQSTGSPSVPVGGDAANGFVKALVAQRLPGVAVSTSPAQGPVALQAAVALMQGKALPNLAFLPIPYAKSTDLKDGVHYFSNLPDSYETVASYTECGVVFEPQEINRFRADNN